MVLINLTQNQDCLICVCSSLLWECHILPPQYSCTPVKLWCWSGKSCSMAGALQMNEDTSSLAPVYEEAKNRKIFAYMSFPNPS